MTGPHASSLVAVLVSMTSPSCSTQKQGPRPQSEPVKLTSDKRPLVGAVKRPVMGVVMRPVTKTPGPVTVKFADIVAKGSRLPIASIKKVKSIHVDGRVVAYVGWLRHKGQDLIVLVPPDGSPTASRRFTEAYDVHLHELIDLAKPSRPGSRRISWRYARARGMKTPILVLKISFKRLHKKSPTPRNGRLGLGTSRHTGTESWQDLLLVPVGAIWRNTLLLTIRRRSADGFGGHSISNLRIEQKGGKTILRGTRQDDLPARRARCLAPAPRKILYELRNHSFRKIYTKHPRPGYRRRR